MIADAYNEVQNAFRSICQALAAKSYHQTTVLRVSQTQQKNDERDLQSPKLIWDTYKDQKLTPENFVSLSSQVSAPEVESVMSILPIKDKFDRIGDGKSRQALYTLIRRLKSQPNRNLRVTSDRAPDTKNRLCSLRLALQMHQPNKQLLKCLQRLYLAELVHCGILQLKRHNSMDHISLRTQHYSFQEIECR